MAAQFDQEYIRKLAHKWKQQTLTDSERAYLESWETTHDDSMFELPDEADHPAEIKARIYQRLQQALSQEPKSIEIRTRPFYAGYKAIAAAAVLLIALSIPFYFITSPKGTTPSPMAVKESKIIPDEILPGGNRATLTLSNGKVINLSEEKEGIIIGEDILYNDGSDVLPLDNMPTAYYAINTPRGGTYQVTLPDGSKVWLNSVSKIEYPAKFGDKSREIRLWGEAFFEVTPNKNKPFIITTPQASITVLGTSFNIAAYDDEPYTSTTVSHGLVRVQNAQEHMLIAAGEQVRISHKDGQMTHRIANLDEALAWKNGFFHFDGASIHTIMRQLARWYDIEIVYADGKTSRAELSGIIQRQEKANQVFEILAETGRVKFKLAGRKITVTTIN